MELLVELSINNTEAMKYLPPLCLYCLANPKFINALCSREAYYQSYAFLLKPHLNRIIADKHGQFLGNAA